MSQLPEPGIVGKCARCDVAIVRDEHGCLTEAMSGTLSAGYGSRNDCCQVSVYVCDDCAHIIAPVMYSALHVGDVKTQSRQQYEDLCRELREESESQCEATE